MGGFPGKLSLGRVIARRQGQRGLETGTLRLLQKPGSWAWRMSSLYAPRLGRARQRTLGSGEGTVPPMSSSCPDTCFTGAAGGEAGPGWDRPCLLQAAACVQGSPKLVPLDGRPARVEMTRCITSGHVARLPQSLSLLFHKRVFLFHSQEEEQGRAAFGCDTADRSPSRCGRTARVPSQPAEKIHLLFGLCSGAPCVPCQPVPSTVVLTQHG